MTAAAAYVPLLLRVSAGKTDNSGSVYFTKVLLHCRLKVNTMIN